MGGGGSKEEAPQVRKSLLEINKSANVYSLAGKEPFVTYPNKQSSASSLLSLQIFLTVYAIAIILLLLFMTKKNDIIK
jgi:hypothetical protein